MDTVSKLDFDKNFGKIFKEYRIKSGLTQEKVAEELNISLKYISRIENGYNGIKSQTLVKAMNLLGFPPDIVYANYLTHPAVKKNVELAKKINSLSDEKKNFISSIIDLVKDL